MPSVFNEFSILIVCHRIPVNIVCLKINGPGGYLCNEYRGLPFIQSKYLKELLFSYSHGKLAVRHQYHLCPIDGGNDGLGNGIRAQFLAYIPVVLQTKYSLLGSLHYTPHRGKRSNSTLRLKTACHKLQHNLLNLYISLFCSLSQERI